MEVTTNLREWAEMNHCTLDPAIAVYEIAAQFNVTADHVRDNYPIYRDRVLARLFEKGQDGGLHKPGTKQQIFGKPIDSFTYR